MNGLQKTTIDSPEGLALLAQGRRPQVDGHGFVTNSLLQKDEWEELDMAIIRMVKLRQNGIADLRNMGLTQALGGLGTMVSQWSVASEKVRPTVSMDGRSRNNMDRVDKKLYGVPVPIVHQSYEIGLRELEASRRLGNSIDTTEAEETAVAVAEEMERILFNGDSSVQVNADTIYGYTTLPARTTDVADGDFGTISNIYSTFTDALNSLSALRYHGPFVVYIADTQYHEMFAHYSDGSAQTALMRVENLPPIDMVKPSDFLDDGEFVMVQMTRNVVDLAIALEITNREWQSPDGMAFYAKVMGSMVPRLKTDHSGNAGIIHVTGC